MEIGGKSQEVPVNRSCGEAGIPEHFCTCLQLKPGGRLKEGQLAEAESVLREALEEAGEPHAGLRIRKATPLVISQMVSPIRNPK